LFFLALGAAQKSRDIFIYSRLINTADVQAGIGSFGMIYKRGIFGCEGERAGMAEHAVSRCLHRQLA